MAEAKSSNAETKGKCGRKIRVEKGDGAIGDTLSFARSLRDHVSIHMASKHSTYNFMSSPRSTTLNCMHKDMFIFLSK